MTKFLAIAAVAVLLGAGSLGVSKFAGFASSVNDELAGKKAEQSTPAQPDDGASRSKGHQLRPYQETSQVLPKTYAGALKVAEQMAPAEEEGTRAVRKVRRGYLADPISSNSLASLFKVMKKLSPSKMVAGPTFRL